MNIQFRQMSENDVAEVYKIEKMLFTDPWSKNSFLEDMNNSEFSHSFVIECDKSVVGYSICWYYLNELHIGNFAIHPDFQNRGLGKVLLTNVLQWFRSYKVAYLEVRKSNFIAINLYKKYGFNVMYHRKKYYSNGEDAVVMVKFRQVFNGVY